MQGFKKIQEFERDSAKKPWIRSRIDEYPELWRAILIFIKTESLANKDKFLLESLENVARKLDHDKYMHLLPPKAHSPRRAADVRTRIKTGLTRWLAEYDEIKVEEACKKYKLVSKNTYYTYKKEGLVYTESDLFVLDGYFYFLAETLKQKGETVLEARIGELVLMKKHLDDVQK